MEERFIAQELGFTEDAEERILARLYGEPLENCPEGLYIPPEALRVFLQSFEGPLDLLLYLIRKQKFDVMDIPMADLTEQYMRYVELVRESDLELAASYLVMSATLMQIKSRLLLPSAKTDENGEPEDPRAELMKRLLEYEKIRVAAMELQIMPREGRDFWVGKVEKLETDDVLYPEVTREDMLNAWMNVISRLKLTARHRISRQELSIREHMSELLKRLQTQDVVALGGLFEEERDREKMTVWFLALLELAKEGLVVLTQAEPYAEIYASLPKDEASLFEHSGN